MLTYINFDLAFARLEQAYRVEASGPEGRSATTFNVPVSTTELENLVLRIGRTRRAMRRIDPPEIEAAKRFGERLFDALFTGDVGAAYRRSVAHANARSTGLRLRLRLTQAPELTNLPWEFLYDRDVNRFLSLSVETPLVRFLDIPERIRPLSVELPLRALAIISNPRGQAPLNVEREWANIQQALGDLTQRGALVLERLERPTMSALQRRLRQTPFHILHFVGHGAFEQRMQDGVLMLEDVQGDEYRVSGQEIGMLLHDHRSLRLVVLNVCEGGRSASDDPFAGVAQSLVQQGVPAVIAMQFEVSDEAAIALAHEFYSAITDSYPVDAALAEARKSVFAQGYRLEWGTPVLYMRAPDGQIFETGASPGAALPSSEAHEQIEQVYTEALALFYTRQWDAATAAFERVLKLDPEHADAIVKLKQARREQELAGRYAAARQAIEAQQWAQALTELNAVAAIDPDYRDVEALARNAQRRKQLAELGSEAQALFRAQSWQAVLNVVDRMRTVDPDGSEYDEIAETSRRKLREQEQAERVAALYNDGLNLMRGGQWRQALDSFEEIEGLVPGYQQTPALLQRAREELGMQQTGIVEVEPPTLQETRAMSRRSRLVAHYVGGTLFCIVLNVGLGHAMWSLGRVPLWLDAIGAVIVGFLFGPWVGLVSGLVSHIVWPLLGLESGTFAGSFAYLVGLVGLIAGFAGRSGLLARRLPSWMTALIGLIIAVGLLYCANVAFNPNTSGPYDTSNGFRQYPWFSELFGISMPVYLAGAVLGAVIGWWRRPQVFTAGLIGLLTGVVSALLVIPIASQVFYSSSEWQNVLAGQWLQHVPEATAIILPSLFANGGISDPLDKLISFMLAYYAVRAIPERWLARLGVETRRPGT